MKILVLLAFIPSLVVADVLCPNSKTTCPENKECCEVDGEYSCCDLEDDQDIPDIRKKVFPGVEIMHSTVFGNVSFTANHTKLHYGGDCDLFSCKGTCCTSSWDGCCEYSMAACCGGNKCCPSFSSCCGDGCCGALQNCCGDGCCAFDYNCCESWCCKKGYRCGKRWKTCVSKGAIISPATFALLLTAASVVFISYRL